jgi:hypothetical protein
MNDETYADEQAQNQKSEIGQKRRGLNKILAHAISEVFQS